MRVEIQSLEVSDFKYLPELTPQGWNDVTGVYQPNWGQDYFFPIKLQYENQIVGVAELIINDRIGWLGNIIVSKDFRNQGFGKKLTEHLIDMAKEKGCESIYLLATSLGRYVYRKLNFIEHGQYLFFQKDLKKQEEQIFENIIPFEKKYKNEVFALDRKAMGEDRSKILNLHLKNAWIYKTPKTDPIAGFFIPTLGNGLIICNHQIAGYDFIKKREQMGMDKIILPEACLETIEYLKQNGYTIFREPATFMYLGKMKTWNPEMVFCRIGGYLG